MTTKVGSHMNIVYLKEMIETKNKFYLVMVAASGGDLFDFILDQPEQHFTERVASCLFFQMLSGVCVRACVWDVSVSVRMCVCAHMRVYIHIYIYTVHSLSHASKCSFFPPASLSRTAQVPTRHCC